jgi:hypothetical protein
MADNYKGIKRKDRKVRKVSEEIWPTCSFCGCLLVEEFSLTGPDDWRPIKDEPYYMDYCWVCRAYDYNGRFDFLIIQ